jgi:hypothetical protein
MSDTDTTPKNTRQNLASTVCPTRVITYAWGDKYIDELLSLTIPALLAPGNLPYVAATAPCELVILTEERFFLLVNVHPAILRARALCPVRLIRLDDLITFKDKYGMALTYALHRGFSDLGPAMTECWQIFINADFILADGCLRNLMAHLARGERIVASPSYCVNMNESIAELRRYIDPTSGTLSIAPRDLAALAIRYRHNTIRGKTINQRAFNVRYMDQFYWLVDDDILLGHQMPIAIVGMRPERYVAEPNAYWDHGLMWKFCPEADVCVLGDSDQFLMVELRDDEVAQDQLSVRWPTPNEIAERMMAFQTEYQRSFARHALTLHSKDLPENVGEARARLRAYVDEILSHLPASLPSHIDHPQWNYHRPGFIEARHAFLSARLGLLTETIAPPASMSELDLAWWKLDGLEKSIASERRELLESRDRDLKLVSDIRLHADRQNGSHGDKRDAHFLDALLAIQHRLAPRRLEIENRLSKYIGGRPAGVGAGNWHLDSWFPQAATGRQEQETLHMPSLRYEQRIIETVRSIVETCELGLQLLDLKHRQPESEYRRLFPRPIPSAAVPFVKVRHGPAGQKAPPKRVSERLYRIVLATLAREALRYVTEIVEAARAKGATNVLRVGSSSGLTADIGDHLSGIHAGVSVAGINSGNFTKALVHPPKFGLCICDLDFSELVQFSEILQFVRPLMSEHGTIVGFHFNQNLMRVLPDSVLPQGRRDRDTVRMFCAGSVTSILVIQEWRRLASLYAERDLVSLMRFAITALPRIAAVALVGPAIRTVKRLRSELMFRSKASSSAGISCASITIEVIVSSGGSSSAGYPANQTVLMLDQSNAANTGEECHSPGRR